MSESSDEDAAVVSKPPAATRRKRQRLMSDDSDILEVGGSSADNELSSKPDDEDDEDELLMFQRPSDNNDNKDSTILIDDQEDTDEEEEEEEEAEGDEEEEPDDDEDDNDQDDQDREDYALIEQLYQDDDDDDGQVQAPKSEAAQRKTNSLRESVVDFFQNASLLDLESIPGVSKKKIGQILTLRPITSWNDLNNKIQNHKSSGINEDVVISAVKTMKSRSVVEKLMNDCLKLAHDIGKLVDKLPEAKQPKCIPKNLKLAPYQLIGLNWLALMHNKRVNGILADEMGLGKTIQVIAFLAYLRESLRMTGHHLIIVPASTLDNWEREFDNWCPEIRILQYYGNQDVRSQIRHYISKRPHECDVILTTYNVAQSPEDRKLFKKLKIEYLVFDEAHMLKNMKSSRYQSLIKIKSNRRILLTGTPLQNNLVELMSLLVFTMPKMFMPKISHVEALFSSASREEGGKTQFERERIEQAKKIMKPFVLRRFKEDVLRDLPKKSEETVFCSMSSTQVKLYKNLVNSFKNEIKDHSREVLEDDNSFANDSADDVKKGAGMLMAMRKLANHPLLILNLYTKDKLRAMAELLIKDPSHTDANVDLIYDDMCVMHDFELHQLCKTYTCLNSFKLKDEDITNSGKFQYLDKLLTELKKKNQRCLLFSQFTMMLDIMEEYLDVRKFAYLRLDGQTKVSDRITLIDDFNQNDDILVFLLSTKAGGLGINLTAANVVIIHDIDFNPYNDKQAEDRSHRLGQKKEVMVYKLIGKDTVEEGMREIASEKLKLGMNMVEQGDENVIAATKDMRSLLRASLKV